MTAGPADLERRLGWEHLQSPVGADEGRPRP